MGYKMELLKKIANKLLISIYKLFFSIKNYRFKKQVNDENVEIDEIISTAKNLRIKVKNINDVVYKFQYQNQTLFITKYMCFDIESAFAYYVTGDKQLTYEVLKANNFSYLPDYKAYTGVMKKQAIEDFERRGKTVVVKPLKGTSGGVGVTANIQNSREFKKAVWLALLFCDTFLVEDYIKGDNYRLTFFEGKLLHACKRIPATIVGDGKNNIKQLIGIENKIRQKNDNGNQLPLIQINNEVRQTLKIKNLNLNSIPALDEYIEVRTICNTSAGGTNSTDMKDIVSESLIMDCEHVLKSLKVVLGGVDIITQDITKSFKISGAVLNEVNTSPGLSTRDTNDEQYCNMPELILKKIFNIS